MLRFFYNVSVVLSSNGRTLPISTPPAFVPASSALILAPVAVSPHVAPYVALDHAPSRVAPVAVSFNTAPDTAPNKVAPITASNDFAPATSGTVIDRKLPFGKCRTTLVDCENNKKNKAILIDESNNNDLPRDHMINRMSKTATVPPKVMFLNSHKIFIHSTVVIWCPNEQMP